MVGLVCGVQSMYAVLCGINRYSGSSLNLQVSNFAAELWNNCFRVPRSLKDLLYSNPLVNVNSSPTSDAVKRSFAQQLQAEHFPLPSSNQPSS